MMKGKKALLPISLFLAIIFAVFLTRPAQAVTTDPAIKATNYQMWIKLDPARKQISEKVTITVQNNSQQDFRQVLIRNMAYSVLKFDRRHYPKGNQNDQTTVQQISAGRQNLTYQLGASPASLEVNLPQTLAPGQKIALTVQTLTSVPYRRDRFGYQKVGGGKIFNLSFCFPYLSDYRHGQWNYHPYSDEGENRSSAISDYQVTFIAPHAYKVASSGSHFTNGDQTTINAPQIRDLAIVASNRFRLSHRQADGVEINNFYVAGPNQSNNHRYNTLTEQVAADSLRLYQKDYGTKYPYPNLDITECPFPKDLGGMEYSGLIMVSDEGLLKKKKGAGQDYSQLLEDVSHEVAHQWFFGTVGSDEFMEPWLDEGMAEFSDDYVFGLSHNKSMTLLDKYAGIEGISRQARRGLRRFLRKAMSHLIKNKRKTIINYPMDKIPKGEDESDLDYDQAATFYLQLMYAMGQKKFFQAMRDYCRTYYMKQATGRDFLAIIRQYDNSRTVNHVINKFINPKYLL